MQDEAGVVTLFLREWGQAIAGLVGAVSSLSFWDKVTVAAAMGALSGGVATAFFCTPIILHYVAPPERLLQSVAGAVGLVLGVIGFLVLAGIHRSARKLSESVPDYLPGLVKRWLDKKSGG